MNFRNLVPLLLFLFTSSASAFFSTPRTEPAMPVAGQPFDVLIDVGECHGFTAPFPGEPGPRTEVDGNTIRMFEPGLITLGCVLPNATLRRQAPLLPAGEYRVEVYMIRLPQRTEIFLSAVNVVVGDPPPVARVVPTLSIVGIAVAIIALLAVARARLVGILSIVVVVGAASAPVDRSTAGEVPSTENRIFLLVDKNSSASAQSIVNSAAFGAGNPGSISPGLGAESPMRANFLLPIRAQGDFQTLLRNNPDEPRSKLERYLIVTYPDSANLSNALEALRKDQNFEYAYIPEQSSFSSQTLTAAVNKTTSVEQPWRGLIGLDSAQAITGGWSIVGIADNGVQVDHPALRAFSSQGGFLGGNFLPEFSLHIALRAPWGSPVEYYYDHNVDEKRAVTAAPACDPGNGFMSATNAGHGTHVAGLIAGRDTSANGIAGACKNCGLMVWRVSETRCVLGGSGYTTISDIADESRLIAALTHLSDIGAQVVNNSFGMDFPGRCFTPNSPSDAYCLALDTASARGIIVSAAAGNNRGAINFPAEDPRVVAVGGIKDSGEFWVDRLDLPVSLLQQECPNPSLVGGGFRD